MCADLIRYFVLIALFSSVGYSKPASAQDRIGQFDSTALATTVTTLNSSAMFDSVDSPVSETLDALTKRYLLVFDTKSVERQIGKSVTQKSKNTIGQSLVELLGQINCTYSIRPDGVIVVQPNPRTTSRPQRQTGSRMQQYVNELIQQYDKDNDKKLSNIELESMRLRPPASTDINRDGFLEAVELLNYYDRGSSSSNSRSASISESRMKQYVKELIEHYDVNRDGKLNNEELEKMRRRPPQSVDANMDGTLDADELLQHYIRTLNRR